MIWYFTNASGDFLATTLTNWNSAIDGSGSTPTNVPWVEGYFDDDLVYAGTGLSEGGYSILFDGLSISPSVIGTCDIPSIKFLGATVASGTFTGDGLVFQGCTITGGTFTGSSLTLVEGSVSGGTFTGGGLTNSSNSISGGAFEISGFTSDESTISPNITLTFEGDPFTGTFNGYSYSAGSYDTGGGGTGGGGTGGGGTGGGGTGGGGTGGGGWNFFPIEVGLLDLRETPTIEPLTPELVTNEGPLVLTSESVPVFPTGAFLDVWYYTGYRMETTADGFLDGDIVRAVPTSVDLGSLTWTWNEKVSLFVSSPVITLPRQSTQVFWDNQAENPYFVNYPNAEDENDGYWVYPPDDWRMYALDDKYQALLPACGSCEGGSASAYAFGASRAVWAYVGQGRFPVPIRDENEFGITGRIVPPIVVVKSKSHLFGDFLSGTDYYRTASVTASTAPEYPIRNIDPKIRPNGYTLTDQTATTRTWTKSQDVSFTITLSDQVTDFISEFSPSPSEYGSTIGSYDFKEFLLFTSFPTDPLGGDASWTFSFKTFGRNRFGDSTNDPGTATLLLYGKGGYSQQTVSYTTIDSEYGERFFKSDSFGEIEIKFVVAVLGMTGVMASGWNDNGATFDFRWGFGVESCFIKVSHIAPGTLN